MCYQPRNNLVKDENGDLLPDYRDILNKWKNYFFKLLNMHNISDVRQMKYIYVNYCYLVHIVLRLNLLLQSWKSINRQVVIKLLQNWYEEEKFTACDPQIYILFGIRKNCLTNGRSLLLRQFAKWVTTLAVICVVET
jgi:hypothetical protein